MTDYSDLKLAVEMISGGKNTVLLDKFGLPSVVVPIAKMTYADVGVGDDTPLPAFVLNGETQPYFCIGKYLDTLINDVAYSLPMHDPHGASHTSAFNWCRNKGDGWTLTTNAMYAAIGLWCRKNGFMPRGNSGFGYSNTHPWEKGIPYDHDAHGRIMHTLTGSGPVSWNHNNDSTGICDLNGNLWEMAAGMRLMDGEINIIPDNNAALATVDQSTDSSLWKAITADGELVPPGTNGTIKIDWLNKKLTFTTGELAGKSETSVGTKFQEMAAGDGLEKVPQLLYGLALFPKDLNGDYGEDFVYLTNSGERMMNFGGRYNSGSGSGVFCRKFDYGRTAGGADFGFRSSYVGTLP